jgi:predicted nucleic acid-binding protein
VSPAVLPYEIGNALASLVRRGVVTQSQLAGAWEAAAAVAVELFPVDVRAALLLAGKLGIYAYDAYFLQCAIETRCPLLTLDRGLKRIANRAGIKIVEQS